MLCRQRLNAFGLYKITKIRVKSQKYGRNTGDFAKMSVYTGMLLHTGIDLNLIESKLIE